MDQGRMRVVAVVLIAMALLAAACGDDSGSPGDGGAAATGSDAAVADCTPPRPAQAGTDRLTLDHDGDAREYDLSVLAVY